MSHRPHRSAWLIATIALVVVACGGSDPAADDTSSVSPTTTGAGDDAGTTSPQTDDESAGGVNVATVTIGSATWEFDADPDGTITDCDPDFFGSFWVIGEADDGSSLNLLLPPEDGSGSGDPASVRVVDRTNEADWTADPTLRDTTADYADIVAEGASEVDTYSIDGTTATGTATFVDENQIFAVIGGTLEAVEPVTGSFEVSCSGD